MKNACINMKKLGKVFHDFRVNRNISLKQIADENVSISQISRFERGESDLSVSKFLIALENMKVETGEFMDALQKNHDSETIEFMSKLVPLEYKRDIAGFRKLFDEQRDKYKKNPSIYQYKLNMILAQSFICKCDPDVPFPKEYIDEVADFIWTTYHSLLRMKYCYMREICIIFLWDFLITRTATKPEEKP